MDMNGRTRPKVYKADAPSYIIKRMNFKDGLYDLVTFQDVELEGRKLLNFKLTTDRSTAVLTSQKDDEPINVRMFSVEDCKEFRSFNLPEDESMISVFSKNIVALTNSDKDKFIFRKTENLDLIVEHSTKFRNLTLKTDLVYWRYNHAKIYFLPEDCKGTLA